jgi:hypothetical protein
MNEDVEMYVFFWLLGLCGVGLLGHFVMYLYDKHKPKKQIPPEPETWDFTGKYVPSITAKDDKWRER